MTLSFCSTVFLSAHDVWSDKSLSSSNISHFNRILVTKNPTKHLWVKSSELSRNSRSICWRWISMTWIDGKKITKPHGFFQPKLEPSIYMTCPSKPATNIRICKEAKNKQNPFVNYLHLMFPSCWMNWFPTSFSPLLLVSIFQQAERTQSATLAVAAQAVCGSGDVKTVRDVCWRWINKRVRRPWCKEIFLGSTRHQDLKYMKDLQFSKGSICYDKGNFWTGMCQQYQQKLPVIILIDQGSLIDVYLYLWNRNKGIQLCHSDLGIVATLATFHFRKEILRFSYLSAPHKKTKTPVVPWMRFSRQSQGVFTWTKVKLPSCKSPWHGII